MSMSQMEVEDWPRLHFNHQLWFLLSLPHSVLTPAHPSYFHFCGDLRKQNPLATTLA